MGHRKDAGPLEAALAAAGGATRSWPARPVPPAGAGGLDLVDVGIIRELAHPQTFQWDIRVSFADVGRRLGVDEETVRTRVRRLEEEGIIAGWEVVPNPGLLGRELVRVELPRPAPSAEAKVREALLAFDGAYLVFEFHAAGPALVFFAPPGAARERQLRVLAAIAGEPRSPTVQPCPPPRAALDPLDWRFVAALRRNPRRPYHELAAELGASERTLRRRLERLTEGQALMLSPIVDQTRVTGVVVVHLAVEVDDPARRAAVDAELQRVPGRMFFAALPTVSRLSFGARGMGEAMAVRDRVAAMAGVRSAVLDVTLRRISVLAWLDEEVARRAGAGEAAPQR